MSPPQTGIARHRHRRARQEHAKMADRDHLHGCLGQESLFRRSIRCLTGQADSPPTGRMPDSRNIGTPTERVSTAAETDPWRGLNVEPSQGCWYRLGTICSDAVGGRTHNDAMASDL